MNGNVLYFLLLAFIGFANALPLPLSGSTMALWLSEAGYSKQAIGTFALFSLPFAFKLLWVPLLDYKSLPGFKNSPRKGWLLFALTGMSLSLCAIGMAGSPAFLALALFSLSVFTGCLYMTGLSYELESIPDSAYGVGSSFVVGGYRIGLLTAGAGALGLVLLLDWQEMYLCMAGLIALGAAAIAIAPEPYRSKETLARKLSERSQTHSIWHLYWQELLQGPLKALMCRSDWLAILFLILTFKLGDQLSKTMEGPFYLSLGFTKAELALASKIWGFGATMAGALLAGFYLRKREPFQTAISAGILHAATLSCNVLIALMGKYLPLLYLASALENLTGGMAMSALIFLIWKITDKRYAAQQYALLFSLFSLKGTVIACLGGHLAALLPWPLFFAVSSLTGILGLLAVSQKRSEPATGAVALQVDGKIH